MKKKGASGKTKSAGITDTFLSFRPELERLVRKFVRQDEVDDIVSETYLRTYERLGDKEIAYPKAFLYKTSRNLVLNYLSRHENRFNQSLGDLTRADVYLKSEELESEIEAQEKFRLFCFAVESLSPKCRKAFLLKRVHGWTHKSIAREMGISVSTVEKHIAKGLLECADSLAENGYDLKGIALNRGNSKLKKLL